MKVKAFSASVMFVLAVGACGDRGEPPATSDTSAASADAGTSGAIPAPELEAAARDVIAFLRGELPFDEIEVADSVTLFVAPEGGGTRSAFAREQLRDASSWVVTSPEGRRSLVPLTGLDSMTMRVGRHLNCMEYPLSTRFAELAALPHVGVKLERAGDGNCLQTWNLTLVFDSTARPPRLVAAVYDQWEW